MSPQIFQCFQMAIPLPPVLLPDSAGDTWIVGRNTPSIGRGGARGDRSVALQAYELINNVRFNLHKLPSQQIDTISQWLQNVGVHVPQWSATGLTSGLGAVALPTVKDVIKPSRQKPTPTLCVPALPAFAAASSSVSSDAHRPQTTSSDIVGIQPGVRSALSHALTRPFDDFKLSVNVVTPAPAASLVSRAPGPPCSNIEAGMRVASLAAMIISNGWPEEALPVLISSLDCWFPREFGELNHSAAFLNGFRRTLIAETQHQQTLAVHSLIPALRLPSHLMRAFDTVSPKSGECLLETTLYYTNASGKLAWMLLDMVPLAADVSHSLTEAAQWSDRTTLKELGTPDPVAKSLPLLEYHAHEKVSDLIVATERRHFLTDDEMKWRKAQDTADGAFFGTNTGDLIGRLLCAKQGIPEEKTPGQLCDWHGIVKGLEHADRLEQHKGGFLCKYVTLTRGLRKQFAYGTAQKVARSTARQLKLTWVRPLAPQKGGTRTAFFECQRVPPNLFTNLAAYYAAAISMMGMLTKSAEKEKFRRLGRSLSDLPLMMFTLARYEMRKPIISYGGPAQGLSVTGFERVRLQRASYYLLDSRVAALHACIGLIGVSARLHAYIWPWSRNYGLRTSRSSIASFLQVLLQCAGVSRSMPLLAKHVVRACVKQLFFGVQLGYQLADSHTKATARGWEPGPFDRVGKVDLLLVPPRKLVLPRGQRRQYLSQHAHHDVQQALTRSLRMLMADRMLFVTRVTQYDSPVAASRRYVRKPSVPNAVRAPAAAAGPPGAKAPSKSHSAHASNAKPEAASSKAGEVGRELGLPGDGSRFKPTSQATSKAGSSGINDVEQQVGQPGKEKIAPSAAEGALKRRRVMTAPAACPSKRQQTRNARSRSPSPDTGSSLSSSSSAEDSSSSQAAPSVASSGSATEFAFPAHPPRAISMPVATDGDWFAMQRFVDTLVAEDENQLGQEGCEGFDESLHAQALQFLRRPAKTLQTHRQAILAARNFRLRLGIPTMGGVPMTHRRRILENSADIFHRHALLKSGVVSNILTATEEGKKQCLKQLFDDLGSYVFKHDSRCGVDEPPSEMFERVTAEELHRQYVRLQELAGELAAEDANKAAVGCEVSFAGHHSIIVPLTALVAVGAQSSSSQLLEAARNLLDGRSACANQLLGGQVTIYRRKKLGVGVIQRVVYDASDMAMYEALMRCPYELISLRSVWHIVYLMHHCCMRGLSTQTLCETANSALRMIERRNSVGRPLSVQRLVEATRLRCAGVRGDSSDLALIWRALRRHFDTHDETSEVHFFRQKPTSQRRLGSMVGASSVAIGSARARAMEERRSSAEFLRSAALPPVSQQSLLGAGPLNVTAWTEHFKPEAWAHMKRRLGAA